jgi:hypothetical protein
MFTNLLTAKLIIWFDKLSYPNEFLEFSKVIVFFNFASMVGVVNIIVKPSEKQFFKNNLAE